MPRMKKTEAGTPVVVTEQEYIDSVLKTNEDVVVNPRPKMTAPEWNNWVLDQLRDEEKEQGNPNIDGLRRLVDDLLGEVVHSAPDDFEGATQNNGMRATVSYRVIINWNNDPNDRRTFGALADVYSGNTDEEYARYPGATADTRAEARALRKALRLKKTVASEEITSLPVTESGLSQYIVKSQERGIEKLCKDLDIDVVGFINSGQQDYKHITNIKYTTAQQMIEQLNRFLRDTSKIPEGLVGYNPDWRNAD